MTVVATLAGEPVAIARETAGRRLTRAEKDRVKAQRRIDQADVRPSIEGLGAEVLGTCQSALNGIKGPPAEDTANRTGERTPDGATQAARAGRLSQCRRESR